MSTALPPFAMRTCTICSHKKRKEIETALAAGESFRNMAERFKTSSTALFRHKNNCIKPIIEQVQAERKIETAVTVLGDLDWLRNEARTLYTEMREASEDYRPVVQVLGEMRQQTKLRAELTGELKRQNIMMLPEWQETLSLLFDALKPYPDAQQAIITQLEVERAKRRSA